MVERQEVEALVREIEEGCREHSCTPHDMSIDVECDTLAALCRAWLAVQDAPQRMVGDGISYGVSVAGTGIANGQSVRIVKEVGDD